MGHATRDIPLIRSLQKRGAEVILAGDGSSLQLLTKEFPELRYYELPPWNITYPSSGNFTWHLLKQAGKVWGAIKREQLAVEQIVTREQVDVVISDNRLGAYSKKAKSIVMSHQLFLEAPFLKGLLNWQNTRMLKRFSEIWVVDVPGEKNLAGQLSYRKKLPFNIRYLGIISRFERAETPNSDGVEVLALLSGPEPQRTLLEHELLAELEKLGKKAVVLLGKPEEAEGAIQRGLLTIYNHLRADELKSLFASANFIVSRSGYTTIMDLSVLGKKAILIPTPGQSEQEYLARYCEEQGWFVVQRQGKIDLKAAMSRIHNSVSPYIPTGNQLEDAVNSIFHDVP